MNITRFLKTRRKTRVSYSEEKVAEVAPEALESPIEKELRVLGEEVSVRMEEAPTVPATSHV